MSTLEAIIIGIVQGLTEFLPISSSGHLVIVPEFMNMQESPPLAFDVLLHLATALAVAGYFARELVKIVLSFAAPGRLPALEVKEWRRLGLWLVVGTVPAAVVGFSFRSFFESLFESTLSVGIFFLVTSALLWAAERAARRSSAGRRRPLDRLGALDALVIGAFQALAIAPGISRSGATISGGIFLGLDREQAAHFSFLLSLPVILGAGVLNLPGMTDGFQGQTSAYIGGAVAAFVSSFFAVHFMLRFLKSHGLLPFSVYTLGVGLVVTVLSLL
ncbi:MAG: undecaprenyl-diphosphatase UppP [Thermoleophilia bacterium]